jgi:8-oxo-dGTP pyrophosphatase MutT (NUDIX family)
MMKTIFKITLLASAVCAFVWTYSAAQELRMSMPQSENGLEYKVDQFGNVHITNYAQGMPITAENLRAFISKKAEQQKGHALVADVPHVHSSPAAQLVQAGFIPQFADKEKVQWVMRNGSSLPEPSTAAAGASVVIQDEQGNILVVEDRNRAGRFTFPGGMVDPKEFPVIAAVREAKEEVGLAIKPQDLVEVARVTRINANRYGFSDYAHFFFTRKFTGTVTIDPIEIKQSAWIPVADLEGKETINGLRVSILVKAIASHLKNKAQESSAQFIPDLRQQSKSAAERDPKDQMYLQLFAQNSVTPKL